MLNLVEWLWRRLDLKDKNKLIYKCDMAPTTTTLFYSPTTNTNRLGIAFSRFYFIVAYGRRWFGLCVRLRLQIDAFNDTNWYTKRLFRVFLFFPPATFGSIVGMPTEIMPRQQSAHSPRKCVHVNFRSVNFTSFSGTHSLATILDPFEFFIH